MWLLPSPWCSDPRRRATSCRLARRNPSSLENSFFLSVVEVDRETGERNGRLASGFLDFVDAARDDALVRAVEQSGLFRHHALLEQFHDGHIECLPSE